MDAHSTPAVPPCRPRRRTRAGALGLWLLLATLAPVAPLHASESDLVPTITKSTRSELKLLAKEAGRIVKELKIQIAILNAGVAAGEISPGEAFIQAAILQGTGVGELLQLMEAFESGDRLLLGACLEELDEVPTGLQPGDCGLRDKRHAIQQRTLAKFQARQGRLLKKFGAVQGKLGARVRFQFQAPPQPLQAAVDLELGVTGGLVKPTELLTVGAVSVDEDARGEGPASVIAVLGVADPANGASVDVVLRDATGLVLETLAGLPISPECLVQARFEDIAPGAYVVELVHGGQRVGRAVAVPE